MFFLFPVSRGPPRSDSLLQCQPCSWALGVLLASPGAGTGGMGLASVPAGLEHLLALISTAPCWVPDSRDMGSWCSVAKLGPPGSSALSCCSRAVGDCFSPLLFATTLGLTLGWRKGVLLLSPSSPKGFKEPVQPACGRDCRDKTKLDSHNVPYSLSKAGI